MHHTSVCLVRGGSNRSGGILSGIFGGKSKKVEPETTQLTEEQREKLRHLVTSLRTDQEREHKTVQTSTYSDELEDARVDMDSIRARGVFKYRHNYSPALSVREDVLSCISKVTGRKIEGSCALDNNMEKAKIITEIAKKVGHSPTNSRLMHLKTVDDLISFYSEPFINITSYTQLARSGDKPKNVAFREQPSRFHPEDTHAWHGGITSFPGTGGEVFGIRNKRILRQFKPKSDWFDYEEQAFDYSRPDEGMPWDPEISKRMDRYPDRKLNLKMKTFVRSG